MEARTSQRAIGTPAKKSAPARGSSPARMTSSPAAAKGKGGRAASPAKAVPLGKSTTVGTKKRPPTAVTPGSFIASKKFDGPKPGMIFQNGPHGCGYYLDSMQRSSQQVDVQPSGTANAAVGEQLDAADVFATLPISMQVAFEARDISALDAALAALPPAEAEHHMQRCVASGLWDPSGAGGGSSSSGGGQLEQEPSPTGESEGQSHSNSSSPSVRGAPDEEEAPLTVESIAPMAHPATAAASSDEGNAAVDAQLFERGPYRADGSSAKSDAPGHKRPPVSAANGVSGGPDEKLKAKRAVGVTASGSSKGGMPLHGATGVRGSKLGETQGLNERVESLAVSLRVEQQARVNAEAELERAQTQVQRLLEKLDAAERFKSDEARAMSAARDVHKRLLEENEALRRQLADAGFTPTESLTTTSSTPNQPEDAVSGTDGAASSAPFDADKVSPDHIEALGFPPASLDPDEVLASLPVAMQAAFDALDVQALHAALAALPPAEASEYMRRCVASGLWDPNGAGGEA